MRGLTKMRNLDVFEHAVCRRPEHDPDIWHDDETIGRAIELCFTCPIRDICLDVGTNPSGDLEHGVWGGLTERRRKIMRRNRERYGIVIFTPADARDRMARLSS